MFKAVPKDAFFDSPLKMPHSKLEELLNDTEPATDTTNQFTKWSAFFTKSELTKTTMVIHSKRVLRATPLAFG